MFNLTHYQNAPYQTNWYGEMNIGDFFSTYFNTPAAPYSEEASRCLFMTVYQRQIGLGDALDWIIITYGLSEQHFELMLTILDLEYKEEGLFRNHILRGEDPNYAVYLSMYALERRFIPVYCPDFNRFQLHCLRNKKGVLRLEAKHFYNAGYSAEFGETHHYFENGREEIRIQLARHQEDAFPRLRSLLPNQITNFFNNPGDPVYQNRDYLLWDEVWAGLKLLYSDKTRRLANQVKRAAEDTGIWYPPGKGVHISELRTKKRCFIRVDGKYGHVIRGESGACLYH